MNTTLDLTCQYCGAPISESAARKTRRCRECAKKAWSEKARRKWETYNCENPHYCVICGKQIIWNISKEAQQVQTCSRHCAMLLVQSRLKEPKEQLEERLIEYIKGQGRYVSVKELREVFHVSDKLLYSRGISCPDLNRRAGNYFPENIKSAEEVRQEYIALLREEPGIRLQTAATRIGVSGDYILSLGIRPGDLRRATGIHNTQYKTKEQIEQLIIAWLKTQPVYRTARDICDELHLDFTCSIKNKGIDTKELNRIAGHNPTYESYYENYARYLFKQHALCFVTQKTFDDLKSKGKLRYDFWFPDYQLLLEIDGMQHTKPTFGPDVLHTTKVHDELKTRYAEEHSFMLVRLKAAPRKTFKDRLTAFIEQIKGMPRVNGDMHTTSNCGNTLTETAEGNPQPSQ